MHTSLSLPLTPRPSLRPHKQVPACLHYVTVALLADWSFPLLLHSSPAYTATSYWRTFSERRSAWWSTEVDPDCSAPDYYVTFSLTSYIPCTKGVTTNLYGGTDNMARFVLHWLFIDYYFLVQLFAASLTMAVSNRVESSSALPP